MRESCKLYCTVYMMYVHYTVFCTHNTFQVAVKVNKCKEKGRHRRLMPLCLWIIGKSSVASLDYCNTSIRFSTHCAFSVSRDKPWLHPVKKD